MKPRVLYVLGYGRSGSTVLGMALGRHPAIVNLGEISAVRTFVPGPAYVAPRACGCLLPLDQCPYWTGVARRLGSMEMLARPDIALSPTLGWRRYAPWLPEPSADLPRWAAAAAALYQAALDEAHASVAVDSSKGAQRAWWLWKSGVVDLTFMWLTRRVDEVMRSQITRGHSAVKTALSWQLAQHQVGRLVREIEGSGRRVLRVSYEHLTEQPRPVLIEILEHAGLPWNEDVLTPLPDHVIGGGPNTKHGGKYSLEQPKGTRPPLPLNARLALKLVSSRYPGAV
ncbi:MAG TPA: hypothetical protein VFN08_17050 [Gemmatimonadales bacterium]|nr:hypothetical protein [Gemmatimonadales bacterium]